MHKQRHSATPMPTKKKAPPGMLSRSPADQGGGSIGAKRRRALRRLSSSSSSQYEHGDTVVAEALSRRLKEEQKLACKAVPHSYEATRRKTSCDNVMIFL